jgi:hypothetical protein
MFHLLRAVFAHLNERTARVRFKMVSNNPSPNLCKPDTRVRPKLTLKLILCFNALESPYQRVPRGFSRRSSGICNLLHIENLHLWAFIVSAEEISHYTPSDEAIWRSTRSVTLQCMTVNLFGNVSITPSEWVIFGPTLTCLRYAVDVIPVAYAKALSILHCNAMLPMHQVKSWSVPYALTVVEKYAKWPTLNWGLVLGSNLLWFRTANGTLISEKGGLFAILVSVTWNLIWDLQVSRVITHPNIVLTESEIHNRWVKAINGALQCQDKP